MWLLLLEQAFLGLLSSSRVACSQLPCRRWPGFIGSTGIRTRSTCAPRRRTSTAVSTAASATAGSRRWSGTKCSNAAGRNPSTSVRIATTARSSRATFACTSASITPLSSCSPRHQRRGNPLSTRCKHNSRRVTCPPTRHRSQPLSGELARPSSPQWTPSRTGKNRVSIESYHGMVSLGSRQIFWKNRVSIDSTTEWSLLRPVDEFPRRNGSKGQIITELFRSSVTSFKL